jgi:hypothetical protein
MAASKEIENNKLAFEAYAACAAERKALFEKLSNSKQKYGAEMKTFHRFRLHLQELVPLKGCVACAPKGSSHARSGTDEVN